jgi:hypothetical protein
VVADEVRKLAERTTTATDEIGRMMNDMRSAKESVLDCIETAVARQWVGPCRQGGDSIDLITGRADGWARSSAISDALVEQSTAAQEIARHVEHISSGWPTVRPAPPRHRRRSAGVVPKCRGPAGRWTASASDAEGAAAGDGKIRNF